MEDESGDDAFYRIRNLYRDRKAKARSTGRHQVHFEQLVGGATSDPPRVDALLTALVRLRNDGELEPELVTVGVGPATYVTTPQIAWIGSLGVYAIVHFHERNLAALERVIPSLLYYECGIVPAGGMWALDDQYRRVRTVIESVMAGWTDVAVHATHAAGRGAPVPGDELVRLLHVNDLTPLERARIALGYEAVHVAARRYTLALREAAGERAS